MTVTDQSYDGSTALVAWAFALAERHLANDLPRRWTHVREVIRLGSEICQRYGDDADLLVAACAVHDLGWSPQLDEHGIPALTGAVYLRTLSAPRRLTNLVGNHGCAAVEADFKGLGGLAGEFPDERSAVRDALWWCDISVGPDGQRMTLDERIAEVPKRYPDDHLGLLYWKAAEPEIRGAYERTAALLAGC